MFGFSRTRGRRTLTGIASGSGPCWAKRGLSSRTLPEQGLSGRGLSRGLSQQGLPTERSKGRRGQQRGATGLALALAAVGGMGCGENVLVSSWELELKAVDGGAEAIEIDLPPAEQAPDAGASPSYQAIRASQNARNRAYKDEKDHDRSGSNDQSNH